MPKPASCQPGNKYDTESRGDPRLPQAALEYRRKHALLGRRELNAINVTAWLYEDKGGAQHIQVNPNITIAELRKLHGPAETPDAETGFHSEGIAAEWFRLQKVRVLEIFTERYPCYRCGRILRQHYPGYPW